MIFRKKNIKTHGFSVDFPHQSIAWRQVNRRMVERCTAEAVDFPIRDFPWIFWAETMGGFLPDKTITGWWLPLY